MPLTDWFVIVFVGVWAVVMVFSSIVKVLGFLANSDLSWMKTFESYSDEVLAWRRKVHAYDYLRLLPAWYFFSKGGWYDPYIYVRGLRSDLSFTDWKDITPEGRAGAIRLSFPTKYEFRAIRKMSTSVPRERKGKPDDADVADQVANQTAATKTAESDADTPDDVTLMTHRISYQFVLQYVRQQSLDPEVEQFQFLIATPSDDVPAHSKAKVPFDFAVQDRNVLFVSPFHKAALDVSKANEATADSGTSTERALAQQPVVA